MTDRRRFRVRAVAIQKTSFIKLSLHLGHARRTIVIGAEEPCCNSVVDLAHLALSEFGNINAFESFLIFDGAVAQIGFLVAGRLQFDAFLQLDADP